MLSLQSNKIGAIGPPILAKRSPVSISELGRELSFIHHLKTKIYPHTELPIQIYSSLTPLEREELLTLADLIIDKERKDRSALLFEANHAKTPLLLDNSPPPLFSGGFFHFLSRIPSLFYLQKESPVSEIHEKILNDQNLGIMIRSKANFKLSFEELLFQKTPIPSPAHLTNTLPTLVKEMKAEAREQEQKKAQIEPLQFFTTV